MKDVLVRMALKFLVEQLAYYLTPEKVDEGKAKLIAYLRVEAKSATPTFDIDDELVEVIAKALRVT